MPTVLPAGPYRRIALENGQSVPYYIVPFDARGVCIGPQTRAHLMTAVATGGFTDIFVFSHGWNNDWSVATGRYEEFLAGYLRMRAGHGLSVSSGYRPLLVGVYWPSTSLVFGQDEAGPSIAGADPAAMDQAVAQELDEIAALTEGLDADDAARLYELAQSDGLDADQSLELARILSRVYSDAEDELGNADSVSPDDLIAVWSKTQAPPPNLDDFGTAGGTSDSGPQAAFLGGLLQKLDPRPAIRTATVWMMKDRAGTVGARGVGPLLRDLLGKSDLARVHLIGHSYGGKIVLSAAAAGTLPRPVESMLLLQPAVSHLCFADRVPGTDRAGGYRNVLERVRKPILSTFSRHDFPLTKTFHLALRRDRDLGEAQIAAAGEPPSPYSALGGYGPRHSNEQLIDIHDVNEAYEFDPNVPIYGLRGDDAISGHGDISNPATWWALYSLASR